MARKNRRTGGAPAGRVLLPTAGRSQVVASRSTERSTGGEQETRDLETAPSDSFHRSDPSGHVAGHHADRAPLPHQATIMDVQRFRRRGAQQRRSSGDKRPAATEEETD